MLGVFRITNHVDVWVMTLIVKGCIPTEAVKWYL